MEKYACYLIKWVITLGICTFATEILVQQQVIQIVNVDQVSSGEIIDLEFSLFS